MEYSSLSILSQLKNEEPKLYELITENDDLLELFKHDYNNTRKITFLLPPKYAIEFLLQTNKLNAEMLLKRHILNGNYTTKYLKEKEYSIIGILNAFQHSCKNYHFGDKVYIDDVEIIEELISGTDGIILKVSGLIGVSFLNNGLSRFVSGKKLDNIIESTQNIPNIPTLVPDVSDKKKDNNNESTQNNPSITSINNTTSIPIVQNNVITENKYIIPIVQGISMNIDKKLINEEQYQILKDKMIKKVVKFYMMNNTFFGGILGIKKNKLIKINNIKEDKQNE
jgi:hypothetical protein